MFNTRRVFLFAFILVMTAMTIGAANAATNVMLLGTGVAPWGAPEIHFSYLANNDDVGSGYDLVVGICYNANGEVMDASGFTNPVGNVTAYVFTCDPNLASLVYPVSFELRDVDYFVPFDVPIILSYPTILSANSDGTAQGAGVPAGYYQYNIVCDTPVYDSPGGYPVGDNMVTAGQAWHLNPEPEAGPDGQNWNAIFVGGVHIGYIPSACVGGPTVFGEMAMFE
jgi:hypothetical protein